MAFSVNLTDSNFRLARRRPQRYLLLPVGWLDELRSNRAYVLKELHAPKRGDGGRLSGATCV